MFLLYILFIWWHILFNSANICISFFSAAFSCCLLSFSDEVLQVHNCECVCECECTCVCVWLVVCISFVFSMFAWWWAVLTFSNWSVISVFYIQVMKPIRTFSKTSRKWHQMIQINSTASHKFSLGNMINAEIPLFYWISYRILAIISSLKCIHLKVIFLLCKVLFLMSNTLPGIIKYMRSLFVMKSVYLPKLYCTHSLIVAGCVFV